MATEWEQADIDSLEIIEQIYENTLEHLFTFFSETEKKTIPTRTIVFNNLQTISSQQIINFLKHFRIPDINYHQVLNIIKTTNQNSYKLNFSGFKDFILQVASILHRDFSLPLGECVSRFISHCAEVQKIVGNNMIFMDPFGLMLSENKETIQQQEKELRLN